MDTYKIERSDVKLKHNGKSMICTFTITHNPTQEKQVFRNIYLAKDYKEAFLIFPTTNDKIHLNWNSKS